MINVFLFLFILLQTVMVAQRTISMNFDLYQNAANNIIAMEGSYPVIYSGNIGGESYSFELEQPTVEFNQNYMKMIATLKINTTLTGYLEFNLEPSIYVNYSLSTDNVTAYLQNFSTYINTVCSQLPQSIRDKIIEHYNSLQLEMYPVKIIEYAQNNIPNFLAIEISNIGFSIQSLQGKLQIGINFDVSGTPPTFICSTYNKTHAKIVSNVSVAIKKLTLYITYPYTEYFNFEGTVGIQKGGEATFYIYHPQNTAHNVNGRCISVLLYSEERGTFLRVYSAAYMPYNDEWTQHTQQVSLD